MPNQVDSVYEQELEAAKEAGFEVDLIDYEVLTRQQNAVKAARMIKPYRHPDLPENEISVPDVTIYRGWMLKPEVYNKLSIALSAKNLYLLNSYESYWHSHYLPESYKILEGDTPLTIWFPLKDTPDFDLIMQELSVFGNKPLILKDYVKSRKHEWDEACFIPSASDRIAVERVVNRFLELQGDDLNIGLVFREFVELQQLTKHSKSGMPLSLEYRIFFLFGEPIFVSNYWEEGEYEPLELPSAFVTIAQKIKSDFFTMDIAKKVDGDWTIIEIGDAQVSGLPDNADVNEFYKSLMNNLSKREFHFVA